MDDDVDKLSDKYQSADNRVSLRKLAEKKADDEAVHKSDINLTFSQVHKDNTSHELRIHQIELEMQNEELRSAQNKLLALQERYFDLYDLAPVGYMTLSQQSIIQETNLAAAVLLGFSRSSLIGIPISKFIVQEDQDIYYFVKNQLFKTHEIQTTEIRMTNQEGTIFWAHLRIVDSEILDNVTIRIILTDITDQKSREYETQLRKAAELSNASKSQFLSNMSHEIRTPINGILGAIQLLELTPLNEEQIEVTKIAHVASEALLSLINDILDYSKIEAGKVAFEQIPFKLDLLIDDTLILLSEASRKKGLQIKVCIDSSVPNDLVGDPFRLRQILINLIGNGIKFTPMGEIKIEVLQIESQGLGMTNLQFRIIDSGVGISEDSIGSLFNRFNQADHANTRRYGGTGLGLAISKGLVENMGGQIWVESIFGKGSTFYFTCSLGTFCRNDQDPLLKVEPLDRSHVKKIRILLVEDNSDSQYVMKLFTRKSEWELTIAENGHEALLLLEKNAFDIILMDLQMPVLNGFDTAQRVRQLKLNTDTPIIALTAHAIEGTRRSCIDAGMNDYMTKPINLTDLHKMIQFWTSVD